VAFPAVHGTNVEDGALQGFFRTLRVPFVGCDVMASALGMDKYASKIILRDAGIPVLPALKINIKHYNSHREEVERQAAEEFGYPMIIKPVDLGSSVGISVARDKDEFFAAADEAFSFAQVIVAERAVTNLREINCAVLGDSDGASPSECEEPVTAGDILSYSDKYGGGGQKGMSGASRLLPAPISDELRDKIRSLAVAAFMAVGCSGVARIDFLMDKDTGDVWVNELNTIPGSLAFYLFRPLGVSYTAMLSKMIDLALKRERMRDELSFSFKTDILKGQRGFKSGAKGAKGAKI
jgi:D-alanine-D-alanine ligase